MKWLPIPLLLFEGDNSNSINNKKKNNNDTYNKNINTSNKKLILKIIKVIIQRIIIMKWPPSPLLLFEGANTNNEMARHSIIFMYLGSK